MKVVLTRSLWIDKNLYPAGEQNIDDEVLRGKIFAKHIQAGHVLEPSQAPRKTAVKSPKERGEALLEKVFGKQKENATPEEAEGLKGGVKSASEDKADEAPSKAGKKNR